MLVILHWYHIHLLCPIPDDSEPRSLWFKALGRNKATADQQNPQAPEGRLSVISHISED